MHSVLFTHQFYKGAFIHMLSVKHYLIFLCQTCVIYYSHDCFAMYDLCFLVLQFLPEPFLWNYIIFDIDFFSTLLSSIVSLFSHLQISSYIITILFILYMLIMRLRGIHPYLKFNTKIKWIWWLIITKKFKYENLF